MSNQRRFKSAPKNVMDDSRLKLYGERLPECKSSPTFSLRLVRSENTNKNSGNKTISVNPRFIVYTNKPGDKDNGKIQAGMDLTTFTTFLNEFEKVVDGKSDGFRIKNMNYTWFNNQRSDKPKHLSTTMVGKEDGKIFIALLATERPKVKFYFRSPQFHSLVRADGQEYTEEEDSVAYARGWMRLLERVTAPLMASLGQEPDGFNTDVDSGGGNGGYSNNSGGGQRSSGGGSRHGGFDDFDDDII